ncbi:peptide chain release factor-like protein [Variovorax sp. E3]|uniref:peptide chain release factor family protein n=1 Tax=Variovorax sp. E3 TaxID=1914993 RepID=UPI0035B2861E
MAGYIELEVTKPDSEGSAGVHAVIKIILNCASKADLIASIFDTESGITMAEILIVPDELQFDLLLDAFQAVSTTNAAPLLRVVCYRDDCPSGHALAEDEVFVEYFNPRPNSTDRMAYHSDSAVRLTHRGTGAVVVSQGARSRHVNLDVARRMLGAKLANCPSPLHFSSQSVERLKDFFPTPRR